MQKTLPQLSAVQGGQQKTTLIEDLVYPTAELLIISISGCKPKEK